MRRLRRAGRKVLFELRRGAAVWLSEMRRRRRAGRKVLFELRRGATVTNRYLFIFLTASTNPGSTGVSPLYAPKYFFKEYKYY